MKSSTSKTGLNIIEVARNGYFQHKNRVIGLADSLAFTVSVKLRTKIFSCVPGFIYCKISHRINENMWNINI